MELGRLVLNSANHDVDAVAASCRESGAELDRGPEDSPPAGRVAVLRDPFGHRWFLNQSLE